VLCCAVLCCAVLCCAVLCCAVLRCAALCCDVFLTCLRPLLCNPSMHIHIHTHIHAHAHAYSALQEESIPDGFYLIGDLAKPQHEWHRSMIAAVSQVTHIAAADANGQLVELDISQEGTVNSNAYGACKCACVCMSVCVCVCVCVCACV